MTRQLTEHEKSNFSVLRKFVADIAFLYLTPTGLKKSILDVVLPVRTLLKTQGIHDFSEQKQGTENKVLAPAAFIEDERVDTVNATFYRPQTKKGDPRVWFSALNHRAKPNDILALFVHEGVVHVVNLSQSHLAKFYEDGQQTETTKYVSQLSKKADAVAQQLLAKLRDIARAGPLEAVCSGDTSIGRTIETALGISINSSKMPDYHGIELKSARQKSGLRITENRVTLFAQVPNWTLSHYKSSKALLDAFGYLRPDGTHKLYCTVCAGHFNAQKLSLRIVRPSEQLTEIYNGVTIEDVAVWELTKLHQRLLEKHGETFWIDADSIRRNNREFFILKAVRHTRNPSLAQFDDLLENGRISVDHLIKRTQGGGAQEKGPLFRLHKSDIPSLFVAETRNYLLE